LSSPAPKKRHPLLGLAAYLLVPGERRVRAARHFSRAGIEALRGLGALVTPEKRPEEEASARERIEID
jgi:plasmid stability protein